MTAHPDDDPTLALISARLLTASDTLSIPGWLLCGLCLARILWQPAEHGLTTFAACLAVLLPTLAVAYLAIRLRLDSQLLADFAAQRLSPTELDTGLTHLGLRRPTPPRSIHQRCQATLKLWRQWLACWLAQTVWLLAWTIAWG